MSPDPTGYDFLDFLNKAAQLHVDKEIHVVLDNLSTHTAPGGSSLAGEEPARHVSLRRGTFTSARTLIRQITDYVNTSHADPKPFNWSQPPTRSSPRSKSFEANVRERSTTTPSKTPTNCATLGAFRAVNCGQSWTGEQLSGIGWAGGGRG